MKILVVEDDQVTALYLRRTLQKLGHQVHSVSNGAEALSWLGTSTADLVISDWMMPEMDGLELCRRLRALQTPSYVYFVLLTARDERDDRLEGLRSGADDFLVKPLDASELAARLEVASRILTVQRRLSDTISGMETANARFTNLYMGLPIACIAYTEDGKIADFNHACDITFGQSARSVDWTPLWTSIARTVTGPEQLDVMRMVTAGEFHRDVEWSYLHPDGTERYLLSSIFPLAGAAGSICGAISTHVDITRRKTFERELTRAGEKLAQQKEQLEEANARLAALATTDGLTGLNNHRSFQERLAEEFARCARYGQPLAVIMADVDQFKHFNDTFGHPAGDQVLKHVAGIIHSSARATDFVARYGGEEFVVVLPQARESEAVHAADRMRRAIASFDWPDRQVTVSMGVSAMDTCSGAASYLVESADRALYGAKRAGRNCVWTCRGGVVMPASVDAIPV